MTPYPLHRSDRQTKILITMFLLTTLVAFMVAELNVYDKVGRVKNGVTARYGPEKPEPDSGGEPLPLETEPLVVRINTFSALLDITHPHVFEMPLMVLVLAHFLMRTRLSGWFKVSNYAVSFSGMMLFLASPWLVRYVTLKAAPILYVGAISLGASVLAMIVATAWDMWRHGR